MNILGTDNSLLFAGGTKYGKGHLINATNMGKFNPNTDSCIQTIDMGALGSVGQVNDNKIVLIK